MAVIDAIRDIAIIIIAIQSIVIMALLGILVWQVWRLIKMVQTEIKPIVADVQETLGTVRGTTTFVSESVVNPMVRTGRAAAGFRRSVQSLTNDLNPRNLSPRNLSPRNVRRRRNATTVVETPTSTAEPPVAPPVTE